MVTLFPGWYTRGYARAKLSSSQLKSYTRNSRRMFGNANFAPLGGYNATQWGDVNSLIALGLLVVDSRVDSFSVYTGDFYWLLLLYKRVFFCRWSLSEALGMQIVWWELASSKRFNEISCVNYIFLLVFSAVHSYFEGIIHYIFMYL